MNIHNFYAYVFKLWRQKRMMKFESIIQPQSNEILLDIGGYPATWTARPQLTQRIDCINVDEAYWDNGAAQGYRITSSVMDGCNLALEDDSYDIVFSNSVIEHVGDWERQQDFARESRRVGKKIWIQTPAFECPLEPHYLAPFVHWLPITVRRKILRWFTPWGLIAKPTQAEIDDNIAHTKLLTKKQMSELYPDCQIFTERMLGFIPKSYVAYRL